MNEKTGCNNLLSLVPIGMCCCYVVLTPLEASMPDSNRNTTPLSASPYR